MLPWTTVGFQAAQQACAAAGFRLCTAAEWAAACASEEDSLFPYGPTYDPVGCNGGDADLLPGGLLDHGVRPAGSIPSCVSATGVADLSGNVKEWTDDQRGESEPPESRPIYVVRGGSFLSPRDGLTCQTDLARATLDTALPNLGFRCCSSDPP